MREIQFPSDSNIRYLPLLYFLPEDMLVKCPTLCLLPRNVRAVIYSEKNMSIVESDNFLNEIMDATALLVFPFFGFGGWKEHYTGCSPIWKLSYSLSLWAAMLEKEANWGLNALIQWPGGEIPFLDPQVIKETTERFVSRGIKEANLKPILDVVREMPCDEDFENWDTNVRKSFLRKWYHTRSKRVTTTSLERSLDNGQHEIFKLEDTTFLEDSILSEMSYQHFKDSLSPQDATILDLRMEGLTHEEIAKRLGYKTHSAILKRVRSIGKKFREYQANSH